MKILRAPEARFEKFGLQTSMQTRFRGSEVPGSVPAGRTAPARAGSEVPGSEHPARLVPGPVRFHR